MKKLISLLPSYGFALTFILFFFLMLNTMSSSAYVCPPTDCGSECGSSGSGCAITQYDENGKLCSWTICYERRANIE
jgi:hypothetical protein